MSLNQSQLSAKLAMSDALARNAGYELFAAEARAASEQVHSSEHEFFVSSLDRPELVQVFFATRPAGASVTLRTPDNQHELHQVTDNHWVWRRRKGMKTPPGPWKLVVDWNAAREALAWVFQAWGTSPLKLQLSIPQRHTAGTPIRGAATIAGAGATGLECRCVLRQPPGDRLDAVIVQQYSVSAALQTQLAQLSKSHWPTQPDRPWWRLAREHKLAALRSAGIEIPNENQPPGLVHVECKPVKDTGFELSAPGTATRIAGTHTLVARVSGHVAGAKDRFERLVYRQIFAQPQPDARFTNTRIAWRQLNGKWIHTLEVSLWDRYRNPLLITSNDAVELKGVVGRPLTRIDGSLAWEIEGPGDNLSLELVRRGERLLTGVDVPLLREDVRSIHAVVSHGRLNRDALRDALDPLIHERVLDLRSHEHVLFRPSAGDSPRSVSLFSPSRAGGYRVELVRENGDVELIGQGSGSRRFALTPSLGPNDSVRVRPVDDAGVELALAGVRFD